jgi:adenine deaminase
VQLVDEGARIVCTSDAGIGPTKPHGVLPHGVVDAASVGFTNAEALASVTSVAAAVCGLAGRKGAITAGYDADLRAVHGNPMAEIGDIHRMAAVFEEASASANGHARLHDREHGRPLFSSARNAAYMRTRSLRKRRFSPHEVQRQLPLEQQPDLLRPASPRSCEPRRGRRPTRPCSGPPRSR